MTENNEYFYEYYFKQALSFIVRKVYILLSDFSPKPKMWFLQQGFVPLNVGPSNTDNVVSPDKNTTESWIRFSPSPLHHQQVSIHLSQVCLLSYQLSVTNYLYFFKNGIPICIKNMSYHSSWLRQIYFSQINFTICISFV